MIFQLWAILLLSECLKSVNSASAVPTPPPAYPAAPADTQPPGAGGLSMGDPFGSSHKHHGKHSRKTPKSPKGPPTPPPAADIPPSPYAAPPDPTNPYAPKHHRLGSKHHHLGPTTPSPEEAVPYAAPPDPLNPYPSRRHHPHHSTTTPPWPEEEEPYAAPPDPLNPYPPKHHRKHHSTTTPWPEEVEPYTAPPDPLNPYPPKHHHKHHTTTPSPYEEVPPDPYAKPPDPIDPYQPKHHRHHKHHHLGSEFENTPAVDISPDPYAADPLTPTLHPHHGKHHHLGAIGLEGLESTGKHSKDLWLNHHKSHKHHVSHHHGALPGFEVDGEISPDMTPGVSGYVSKSGKDPDGISLSGMSKSSIGGGAPLSESDYNYFQCGIPGRWQQELDEGKMKAVARVAVRQINKLGENTHKTKLLKVLHAKSQSVGGKKYDLMIETAPTKCPAKAEDPDEFCEIQFCNARNICHIIVHVYKELKDARLEDHSCFRVNAPFLC